MPTSCKPVQSFNGICPTIPHVEQTFHDGISVKIGRPCQPRESSPDCSARKGRLAVLIDDAIREESTDNNFRHSLLQLFRGRSAPPRPYGILVECTTTPSLQVYSPDCSTSDR